MHHSVHPPKAHHAAVFRRRAAIALGATLLVMMYIGFGDEGAAMPASPVHVELGEVDEAHRDLANRDGASEVLRSVLDTHSLEATYCRMTNPHGSETEDLCIGVSRGAIRSVQDDAFVLVVTVAEADLWTHGACDLSRLRWLASIAIPTVVFVKSNGTRSFRAANHSWSASNNNAARHRQRMFLELNPGHPSTLSRPVFKSVLRDVWEAHLLGEPSTLCTGASWVAEKVANVGSELFLFETSNVGDEAMSIADVSLRLSRVAAAGSTLPHHAGDAEDEASRLMTLDAILLKAQRFIFVHDHESSWHALNVVQQLRCLCVRPSVEHYRTLTTPAKAYLLQCMPLKVNATEMLAAVLKAAPAVAAKNNEFVAFQETSVRRSAASSDMFRKAFEFLLSVDRNDEHLASVSPDAVVRDCCSSFIVSRDAILGSLPASGATLGWRAFVVDGTTAVDFWFSLRNKIARQPADVAVFFDESFKQQNDLDAGELSMYLERFWRTIFGASRYDTHRDLAVDRCHNLHEVRLECPPLQTVRSNADLHPLVQQSIAAGNLRCDKDFSLRNPFKAQRSN